MASIEAKIRGEGLQVFIPIEYLKNAFEMGVTTNVTGKVVHDLDMLQHFARELESSDDGSDFGRFIDSVCEDAIQSGEPFVEPEDS
jgi:hypothetical protein